VSFGAGSADGIASIRLPRSFHGVLILKGVAARMKIHDTAVTARLTKLGETTSETRYLIGDMVSWKEAGDKCLINATPPLFEGDVGFVDVGPESQSCLLYSPSMPCVYVSTPFRLAICL
jgi:hypothetical protein